MSIADRVLESYLDESLPVEEAASVERLLRDDPSLLERLSVLIRRRDLGDHSLGAIWQRQRITCADRSTLGAYLLGVLDGASRRYWDLHLNVVECRFCRANLDDMRLRREARPDQTTARRRKFFESSVGRLAKP
ncbi:MAG: hypothetical protein K8U03_23975 [Planctomycetia bacterium]|nr:hypothetical protein [Planctomycetia bacterium]